MAFQKLGANLNMEELMALMNEIDTDKNGSVDIDEFCQLLSSVRYIYIYIYIFRTTKFNW